VIAQFRQTVSSNLFWLLISIVLALLVWFIANIQANPIEQTQFESLVVQVELPEGMIITNDPRPVNVLVRAQQSVLELLSKDDLVVHADARDLGPGSHVVPLTVDSPRPISADTQPAQISVELAQIETQQKPVVIDSVNLPPVNFRALQPVSDVVQAQVRGAANLVSSVTEVRGQVDLEDRRTSFETTVDLSAYDTSGAAVPNVTIEPPQVMVMVEIVQRNDVKAVTIEPLILYNTIPTNYLFGGASYQSNAESVLYLTGSPEALAEVGDTVQTAPIDLRDRTADFEITVPLDLPNDELEVLGPSGNTVDRNITFDIAIRPRTDSRPFENVPIEVRNLAAGLTVNRPDIFFVVVLTGPVVVLDEIAEDDLVAVLDLAGFDVGTYEIEPRIEIKDGQIDAAAQNIDVNPLPQRVSVTIAAPTPAATQPSQDDSTPQPDS